MDTKLKEILETYPGIFEILTDRNKLLCKLTKHELPLNLSTVQSYINGKKFQRLYEKVQSPKIAFKVDDQYKDYFAPSKKGKSRIYCNLTKKEINNLPHEIEQHVTGYRFMKAKFYKREEKDNHNDDDEGKAALLSVKLEDGNSYDNDIDIDQIEDTHIPDFAISSDEDDKLDGSKEDDVDECKNNEDDDNDLDFEDPKPDNNVIEVLKSHNKKRMATTNKLKNNKKRKANDDVVKQHQKVKKTKLASKKHKF